VDTGLGACTGVDAEGLALALGVGFSERYQFLDRRTAVALSDKRQGIYAIADRTHLTIILLEAIRR
jgi:hypothetical protein